MAESEPPGIIGHQSSGQDAELFGPSAVVMPDSDTTRNDEDSGSAPDESEKLQEELDDTVPSRTIWRQQRRSPALSSIMEVQEDIDVRRVNRQTLIDLLEKSDTDAEFDEEMTKRFAEDREQWGKLIDISSMGLQPSPLLIAIRNRLCQTAHWLIGAGVNVDAEDEDQMGPLHYACMYTPGEDFKLALRLAEILKAKKGTAGPDSGGRNPLHHALRQQLEDEKTIKALCDVTDIGQKDEQWGWTPLHVAANTRNKTATKCLLERKADASVADSDGWTPLMTAIISGGFEVSRQLLDCMKSGSGRESVAHAQDHRGMTALMRICQAGLDGQETTKQILIKLAVDILDLGAKIGVTDIYGQTAIHHAMNTAMASNGANIAVANLIIERAPEEDLLRQGEYRETAFDDAFKYDEANIQSLLNKAISRLLSKDRLRHNLFRWLARRRERHELALRYLRKMPADETVENIPPSHRWTLIQWAICHQLPGILLSLSEIPDNETPQDALDGAIKEGKDLIEKLKPSFDTQDPPLNQLKMRGKSTIRVGREREGLSEKDEGNQLNVWTIMSDLLDLLETKRIKRRKETREISQPTGKQKEVTSQFYAAIVEMLPDDEDSSYSYKFRRVDEVVYGNEDSRINTIREAVQEVQKLEHPLKETAKKSDQSAAGNERNYVWVHLPSNNITWMMDAMRKITQQIGCTPDEFERLAAFLRSSSVEIPDQTSPSRFMRPRYVKSERKGTKSEATNLESSATYMPFLSLSLHPQEDRRGASVASQPVGMREKLFDAYKGSIHGSPTLDEYYHHFTTNSESQTDREIRNNDQIVTKHLRNQNGSEQHTCELLRVSQLWVWTIGSKWMITSTSCAYSDVQNDFVLGFLDYLQERPEGGTQGRGPTSPAELSAAIVDYCVESYERNGKSHTHDGMADPQLGSGKTGVDRSIRQIFSDFINEIGRKEAKLFKDFNNRIKNERPGNKESLTQSRTRVEGTVKNWRDAAMEAADLLVDIKDVRDELNILRTVAELQRKVQQSMSNIKGSGDNSRAGLAAVAVLKDITELDSVAGRVYEAVNATITLHESEIANLQSEIAIIQTTETMRQGKTVMIFTAVTSIFLPLSFLTSLFALDVASFLLAPWWSLIVIFVVPLPFLAVGVDYVRDFQVAKFCFKAVECFMVFVRGIANLFKIDSFLLIYSRRIKKQAKKTWELPTAD